MHNTSNIVGRITNWEPGDLWRWRVSVVLTTASVILWAIALEILARKGMPLDDMGIVHSLPAPFWAGGALLTIASGLIWTNSRSHTSLLVLQIALLVAFVWLTPFLLGHTPTGTRYSYGYDQLTLYILRYGHLDPQTQWYHIWPTFNLLSATIVKVTGLPGASTLPQFGTVIAQFVLIPAMYFFFKSACGSGNRWGVAAWFFVVVNWTAQTYLSPQCIAILLFLLFMGVVYRIIGTADRSRASINIVAVILIAALAVTHLLTAIMGLFTLIALSFLKTKRSGLPILATIAGVVVVAWIMFTGTSFFGNQVSGIFQRALQFDNMWFWNIGRATTQGSDGHMAVVAIRMRLTVVASLLALVGWILLVKTDRRKALVLTGMILGAIALVPFQFYQGELFSRVFLYSLPASACLVVALLRKKILAFMMVATLVVLLPFGVIALHGNAMFDDVTPSQVAYWKFLSDKTERGNLVLGGIPMAWTMGYPDRYQAGFDELGTYGVATRQRIDLRQFVVWDSNNYLGLTPYEDAALDIYNNFPNALPELQRVADAVTYLQLVYDNGEVFAYYDAGTRPK